MKAVKHHLDKAMNSHKVRVEKLLADIAERDERIKELEGCIEQSGKLVQAVDGELIRVTTQLQREKSLIREGLEPYHEPTQPDYNNRCCIFLTDNLEGKSND